MLRPRGESPGDYKFKKVSGVYIDNIKLLWQYLLGSSENILRRLMLRFRTNKEQKIDFKMQKIDCKKIAMVKIFAETYT